MTELAREDLKIPSDVIRVYDSRVKKDIDDAKALIGRLVGRPKLWWGLEILYSVSNMFHIGDSLRNITSRYIYEYKVSSRKVYARDSIRSLPENAIGKRWMLSDDGVNWLGRELIGVSYHSSYPFASSGNFYSYIMAVNASDDQWTEGETAKKHKARNKGDNKLKEDMTVIRIYDFNIEKDREDAKRLENCLVEYSDECNGVLPGQNLFGVFCGIAPGGFEVNVVNLSRDNFRYRYIYEYEISNKKVYSLLTREEVPRDARGEEWLFSDERLIVTGKHCSVRTSSSFKRS